MVPLSLLPIIAVLLLLCAFMVAKARRLSRRRIVLDGTAAMVAAAASIVPGIGCYVAVAWGSGGQARNAGAAFFLAFPLVTAATLQVTSRRYGFPPGSLAGAVLLGLATFFVIAAWAVLYLKGPSGGWGVVELLVYIPSLVLSYSGAACLGWWCGRSIRRTNA